MSYTISPFATGGPFGGFQSTPGTGVQSTITIDFSADVPAVTITIQDPTYSENILAAFNSAGQLIDTVRFAYTGQPGQNVPDTRTVRGAIRRITLTPDPGDYVAYSGTFSVATDTLRVNCSPSALTRADSVTCSASLASGAAFTVVERESSKMSDTAVFVSDRPSIEVAAGEAYEWRGPALESTRVTIGVTAPTIAGVHRESASFFVSPRTFSSMALTAPSVFLRALRGAMTSPPVPIANPAGVPAVQWGQFDFPLGAALYTDSLDSRLGVADAGPDSGLVYFAAEVVLPDADSVFVHPALYPTAIGTDLSWYLDQNGSAGGHCSQTQTNLLASETERHEGRTQATNSHYGVFNSVVAQLRPSRSIEAIVASRRDSSRAVAEALDVLFEFADTLRVKQHAFDSLDYPLTFAPLGGCRFDYNSLDP